MRNLATSETYIKRKIDISNHYTYDSSGSATPESALPLLSFIYFTIVYLVSFTLVIYFLYSHSKKLLLVFFGSKDNLQVHLHEGNERQLNL
jgi:hypothetical protein